MTRSVILLSSIGGVSLEPIINACQVCGIEIAAVIIDGKFSSHDQSISRSRLDPAYEINNLEDFHYPSIPFYFIQNHNSKETIELIDRLNSSYVINAGTSRIFRMELLCIKKGVLNAHPGLLPQYRGCSCVEWALFNNDEVGATVHFMNEKIDEGPIILKEILHVPKYQPYELVRTRMLMFSAALLAKGIIECYEKDLSPEKLPLQSGGTYFKPIPYSKLIQVKQKLVEGKYVCGNPGVDTPID